MTIKGAEITINPLDKLISLYEATPEKFIDKKQGGARSRFFNDHGKFSEYDGRINKPSELGNQSQEFAQTEASKLFLEKIPLFSSGYDIDDVDSLIQICNKLDKDLMGDPTGTLQERAQANNWKEFWDKVKHENNLKDDDINELQEDFKFSYRYQTLDLSKVAGMDENKTNAIAQQWRQIEGKILPILTALKGKDKTPEVVLKNVFGWYHSRNSSEIPTKIDNFTQATQKGNYALAKLSYEELLKSKMITLFSSEKTNTYNQLSKQLNRNNLENLLINAPSKDKKFTDFLQLMIFQKKAEENLGNIYQKTSNYKRNFFTALKDGFKDFPKNIKSFITPPPRTYLEIAQVSGNNILANDIENFIKSTTIQEKEVKIKDQPDVIPPSLSELKLSETQAQQMLEKLSSISKGEAQEKKIDVLARSGPPYTVNLDNHRQSSITPKTSKPNPEIVNCRDLISKRIDLLKNDNDPHRKPLIDAEVKSLSEINQHLEKHLNLSPDTEEAKTFKENLDNKLKLAQEALKTANHGYNYIDPKGFDPIMNKLSDLSDSLKSPTHKSKLG